MTTQSKALAVFAHPDDADYGCSGSFARWGRRERQEVAYVVCTDGSKGTEDRSLTSNQLSELRKREQRAAAEVLGLSEVVFLDHPDGGLEPSLELRRDITRQIRRLRPEIVVTTFPVRDLINVALPNYIGHPDHHAAGEATLSAVFPSARDHLAFPELLEEGLEPWAVSEVWIMGPGAKPNMYNPLTQEDVDRSIEALMKHESQIADPERVEEFMRARRREDGPHCGSEYAERFLRFALS